jgi:hypothetical protein
MARGFGPGGEGVANSGKMPEAIVMTLPVNQGLARAEVGACIRPVSPMTDEHFAGLKGRFALIFHK